MNVPEVSLPRKGRRWDITGLGLTAQTGLGDLHPPPPELTALVSTPPELAALVPTSSPPSLLRWSPLLPFQSTALILARLDGQGHILPSIALRMQAQGREQRVWPTLGWVQVTVTVPALRDDESRSLGSPRLGPSPTFSCLPPRVDLSRSCTCSELDHVRASLPETCSRQAGPGKKLREPEAGAPEGSVRSGPCRPLPRQQ